MSCSLRQFKGHKSLICLISRQSSVSGIHFLQRCPGYCSRNTLLTHHLCNQSDDILNHKPFSFGCLSQGSVSNEQWTLSISANARANRVFLPVPA